jgi:ABC-type Zn uptake system ZnuABC Zn-binding protein ZnuA
VFSLVRPIGLTLGLLGVGFGIAGCTPIARAEAQAGGPITVVATTTQVGDFARIVGGAHVAVTVLVQPNVDAHEFEVAAPELEALRRARLIVRNGVGLEPWFDNARAAAEPAAPVVVAADGVAVHRIGGSPDPHIWLDPMRAKVMVGNIAKGLATADPKHAANYNKNLADYQRQLDLLDADIARGFANVSNKKLVTNHDAFGYFAERYGFTVVGAVLPSFDSAAELSASQVTALVRRIKRNGVKAVFSEASLPARTATAIAKEAGVRVVAGDGALYGDSLGPVGSDGATYVSMMRHNARVIAEALR